MQSLVGTTHFTSSGPDGQLHDGGGQSHNGGSIAHHYLTNGHHGQNEHELAQSSAAAAIYAAQQHAAVQQMQQHNGGEGSDEMGAPMQYPTEALQYAYQPQMAADGGAAVTMQYPFGMGLGSLQLAQMGSLLQAGQQYALLSGAEDAVYVNQKQFHRILKRRQARMKLEAKFKIIPRKEWLHDSRHKHAKNRQRGPGGRFLSKAERDKLDQEDYDGGEYGDEEGSPSGDAASPTTGGFSG